MLKKLFLVLILLSFSIPSFANNMRNLRTTLTKNAPSDFVVKIEYSGDNPVYIGKALKGTAVGDDDWIIFKYTYSGDNITDIQSAYGTWSNRASLSYN